MFPLGTVVRLRRGWTPLVVIDHLTGDQIRAKYANHDHYPVTAKDYEEPCCAMSTQRRHFSEFVPWDGEPISKVHFLMPNRYKSRSMPDVYGTFLNTTSRGDIVIEDDQGGIHVLSPSDAARDIPFTFEAKSVNSSYRCDYTLPKGVSVDVGDLLLSSTNNLYVVTKLDTERTNNKGEFKGHRILKESL